jgi:hypothetical protein
LYPWWKLDDKVGEGKDEKAIGTKETTSEEVRVCCCWFGLFFLYLFLVEIRFAQRISTYFALEAGQKEDETSFY